jgi:hypothetical protein
MGANSSKGRPSNSLEYARQKGYDAFILMKRHDTGLVDYAVIGDNNEIKRIPPPSTSAYFKDVLTKYYSGTRRTSSNRSSGVRWANQQNNSNNNNSSPRPATTRRGGPISRQNIASAASSLGSGARRAASAVASRLTLREGSQRIGAALFGMPGAAKAAFNKLSNKSRRIKEYLASQGKHDVIYNEALKEYDSLLKQEQRLLQQKPSDEISKQITDVQIKIDKSINRLADIFKRLKLEGFKGMNARVIKNITRIEESISSNSKVSGKILGRRRSVTTPNNQNPRVIGPNRRTWRDLLVKGKEKPKEILTVEEGPANNELAARSRGLAAARAAAAAARSANTDSDDDNNNAPPAPTTTRRGPPAPTTTRLGAAPLSGPAFAASMEARLAKLKSPTITTTTRAPPRGPPPSAPAAAQRSG